MLFGYKSMIRLSGHLTGITLSMTLCKESLLENVPCFSTSIKTESERFCRKSLRSCHIFKQGCVTNELAHRLGAGVHCVTLVKVIVIMQPWFPHVENCHIGLDSL